MGEWGGRWGNIEVLFVTHVWTHGSQTGRPQSKEEDVSANGRRAQDGWSVRIKVMHAADVWVVLRSFMPG